jgi:hypothetical protein
MRTLRLAPIVMRSSAHRAALALLSLALVQPGRRLPAQEANGLLEWVPDPGIPEWIATPFISLGSSGLAGRQTEGINVFRDAESPNRLLLGGGLGVATAKSKTTITGGGAAGWRVRDDNQLPVFARIGVNVLGFDPGAAVHRTQAALGLGARAALYLPPPNAGNLVFEPWLGAQLQGRTACKGSAGCVGPGGSIGMRISLIPALGAEVGYEALYPDRYEGTLEIGLTISWLYRH